MGYDTTIIAGTENTVDGIRLFHAGAALVAADDFLPAHHAFSQCADSYFLIALSGMLDRILVQLDAVINGSAFGLLHRMQGCR